MMKRQTVNIPVILVLAIALFFYCPLCSFGQSKNTIGQWEVLEMSVESTEDFENPFMEVSVDVVFAKGGSEWKQPAFWNGGKTWTVRFAFPETGTFNYRVESNDRSLDAKKGTVDVKDYQGDNPLIKHGHIRVSENGRYFEHADGTPFFWMGDTWWKCLSKRISFDEFKELTDDRAQKGFSLVQIVCGPYPDEDFYTDWWDNEGGKPYLNREFTRVNLEYFKYADQRFEYLVQSGIVPAIVGAWGRHDCDAMKYLGVEGMTRHWRNLIARYGAYPTVWIAGGEADGQLWSEVSLYVKTTDPYNRPITVHPHPRFRSVVESVGAEAVNFDFLQTGHGRSAEDPRAIGRVIASYNAEPLMPVLIGEHSYEEHMKAGPPYTQRYVFWGSILSGACGLTYGAAGIWHAGIEGFPASVNTYDFTTWKQGMDYPGSAQMGLNARFLEKYPWEQFEPHPEWTGDKLYSAGIPGEIRMVYMPRPPAYQWEGFKVYELEKDIPYHAFFFDPSTGRTFDRGTVMHVDTERVVFKDDLSKKNRNRWSHKGSASVLNEDVGEYLSVSVDASSAEDAGIIVNYKDKDNFLVGLYSSKESKIFFHDVVDGDYGEALGAGRGPLTRGPRVLPKDMGKDITLTVSLQNGMATLEAKTDKGTFASGIEVGKNRSGKIGLWQGESRTQQQYENFEVKDIPGRKAGIRYLSLPEVYFERVPSPQDWVLVMEKRQDPPNILFILVDDLGWRDLACYGHEIHETPNIDKLANEGMRFTDAYAACPVCSPTRASIMAGKYPSRTGITNWLPGDFYTNMPLLCEETAQQMELEETTLAEALKEGGYQTAFVGKWHLGKKPFYPQHQGFDINVAGNHWGHPHGPTGFFSPYKMEHLEDGPEGEYLTDRLTTETIRVMKGFSAEEQPWLMYMSYYTVHAPFHSKPEKTEKYRQKAEKENVELNAAYAGMVESLDENVGRLLRWLEEKGLRENTIVVFTSDNGGFHMATHNRPLRGFKGELYDGGIRVPWIIRWPGVTKPGADSNRPVISTDLYPTLLEICGQPLRPEQHIDGVSLVPALKGDHDFDRGPMIWHYPHYLPRHSAVPGSAIRQDDWKFIQYYEDGRQELYNLKDDIGESENLAVRMPEKAAGMKAILDAMLKEHGAKIPAPDPDYKDNSEKNNRQE